MRQRRWPALFSIFTALFITLPCANNAVEPAVERPKIAVAVFDDHALESRLRRLGFIVSPCESPAKLTAERLVDIDVLFIGAGMATRLAAKHDVIAGFVKRGGGLIVEQPNDTGTIKFLPDELALSVASCDYDGSHSRHDPIRDMALTDAGKEHRITAGLMPTELGSVADQVSRTNLSPAWTVLAVQCEKPENVGIAIAEYGYGRVVFEAGALTPLSMAPGSDRFVCRLLYWAANAGKPAE